MVATSSMIDAVSPATGLVPPASRPVKNVCSRTLVGPHSVSYQLWYAVGIGHAGGAISRNDGLEGTSPASRRLLGCTLAMEPDVSDKDGGDGSDCAEVDGGSCCCSGSSLTFEWAEKKGVRMTPRVDSLSSSMTLTVLMEWVLVGTLVPDRLVSWRERKGRNSATETVRSC